MNKRCETVLSYAAAAYRIYHPSNFDRKTLREAAWFVLKTHDADPDDCLIAHVYR